MEIPCYHCQTLLPLERLTFCRDCCVSFCSACCFENHSAACENGRLQFHDMSKWSDSNQKEAACLILDHFNDHMEEVKTEGEAEVVQLGQRIDRLKELLQKQLRVQLENRLSHLQTSVKTIRDAFNVTDSDCLDLSTSRRSFETEARFLLDKLVDGGLRIDLHPEANPVMLGIRRVSDISDAFCSSDDPFSSTVEDSATLEDENMHAEPLSTSDETGVSDNISEGNNDAQCGSSDSVHVKMEPNETSFKDASDVDIRLIYAAEDRTASSMLSDALPSIEFDPEYARLVDENKKMREAVLQVKEERRQKEIARLQKELFSMAREDEASERRHLGKRKKSRSRQLSAEDKHKVKHSHGTSNSRRHNGSSVVNRSKQHSIRSGEHRCHYSGKDEGARKVKHPKAAAERGHKSSSAAGRSKRHSTCFVEHWSRASDVGSEDSDYKYLSAINTAGISRTSTPAMFEEFHYDYISEPELVRLDNDDFMDDSFGTVSRHSRGSTGFRSCSPPASRMRTASPHVTPTSPMPRYRSPIMSYTPTSSRRSQTPAYKRAFASPNSSVSDEATSQCPSANFVMQEGGLPNDWKLAWDVDGRPYYYHVKSRRRRYEMPDEDDSAIEEAFLAALASRTTSEQSTSCLASV